MTKVPSPPNYEPPINVASNKFSSPWLQFFSAVSAGDNGQSFTPIFVGLTTVGTPTITGRYYQVGQLAYMRVDIIPATSTTAVIGTTYISNFPLTIRGFGLVAAVTNAPSAAISMADSTNNRIYTPNWSAVTSQITIIALLEAN